jgi:hypothetical protein
VSTFVVVIGPEHTRSQSGFAVPAPHVPAAGVDSVPLHVCCGMVTHIRCGYAGSRIDASASCRGRHAP